MALGVSGEAFGVSGRLSGKASGVSWEASADLGVRACLLGGGEEPYAPLGGPPGGAQRHSRAAQYINV